VPDRQRFQRAEAQVASFKRETLGDDWDEMVAEPPPKKQKVQIDTSDVLSTDWVSGMAAAPQRPGRHAVGHTPKQASATRPARRCARRGGRLRWGEAVVVAVDKKRRQWLRFPYVSIHHFIVGSHHHHAGRPGEKRRAG
jgi:hypothetical protein